VILPDVGLGTCFSQFVAYLSALLIVSFVVQKLWDSMQFYLFVFTFYTGFWDNIQKVIVHSRIIELFPTSSSSFTFQFLLSSF
jgi:hypothetical protein